jgi:hypothetical protein
MTRLKKTGFSEAVWDSPSLLAQNSLIYGNALQKSRVFGTLVPPMTAKHLFSVELSTLQAARR